MRDCARCLVAMCALAVAAFAQQPAEKTAQPSAKPATPQAVETEKPSFADASPALEKLLASKVTAEWDAIKARDKEAFGKLLAADFIAVESDGDGARNRYRAANELANSAVHGYTLERMKAFSLSPTTAFVKYESTMEFPLKSVVRYKRMWISEIWVQQGADWKLWRYQETPVR